MKDRSEAWELEFRIRELRERGAPAAEIAPLLGTLGELALQEGNVYLAFTTFGELNDAVGVRKAAECGMKICNGYYDIIRAYRWLNDLDGLRKAVAIVAADKDVPCMAQVVPESVEQKVAAEFRRFVNRHGFSHAVAFNLVETLNAADALGPQYDVGVGVAKGGLYSAFIFNRFGLPVIVAEAHRKGTGATFVWHDDPSALKGKRILVFDKDIVTGRTLRRVLREINEHEPGSVDAYLNYDAVSTSGIGSHLERLPEGFNKAYYPAMMNYEHFLDAVLKLEEKLKGVP